MMSVLFLVTKAGDQVKLTCLLPGIASNISETTVKTNDFA